MNSIMKAAKVLLNLLYPLHCASCGRHLRALNNMGACAYCLSMIKRNPPPYCPRCGRSPGNPAEECAECRQMKPVFSHSYSACLYEGPMKDMICAFKYRNRRELSMIFTKIMLDFTRDNPQIIENIDMITFIPLDRKRLSGRGFNQSELLAAGLGRWLGMPVKHLLDKAIAAKHQNDLSREERLTNIMGTFKIKNGMKDVVKGAKILIIDDVMTTGSTLNESSRELINAGAAEARCFTLARGM